MDQYSSDKGKWTTLVSSNENKVIEIANLLYDEMVSKTILNESIS